MLTCMLIKFLKAEDNAKTQPGKKAEHGQTPVSDSGFLVSNNGRQTSREECC